VILLTMLGWQLGVMNRAAWQDLLQPGPASLDQAVAAITGTLALLLIIWLLIALLVSLLAAAGSGTSALNRAAINLAHLLAPMILRNAVAALLGVALAAAPAAADVGHSASAPARPVIATRRADPPTADQHLSPAWIPGRDGLPGTSTLPSPDLPSSPTQLNVRQSQIAVDPELLPGWIPSRPPRSSPPRTTARELAPVVAAPVRARVDPDDQVVVRRGDTLWDVASRHLGDDATDGEIAQEWPHWFTANRAVIGPDPDHLVAGQRLRAPGWQSAASTAAQAARRTAKDGATR
jgi:hypothetical protein